MSASPASSASEAVHREPPVSTKRQESQRSSLSWSLIVLGVALRALLALFFARASLFAHGNIELNAAPTDFKRVAEGVHLVAEWQMSPYDSPAFVSPPLVLVPFLAMRAASAQLGVPAELLYRCFFVLLDVLIAGLIYKIAYYASEQRQQVAPALIGASPALVAAVLGDSGRDSSEDAGRHARLATFVSCCYLFNPIIIASCTAMSLASFNNLFLALVFVMALRGRYVAAAAAVACAAYLSVYPVVLLIALVCMVTWRSGRKTARGVVVLLRAWAIAAAFVASLALLLWCSFVFCGRSWRFLARSYAYMLQAGDLTPNWGNFWYFFTEVFDHFRQYFLFMFHAHIISYLVPLTVRFRRQGLFLGFVLTAIVTVFKPYPTLADFSFYMCLLFIFLKDLRQHMRYGFFIAAMIIYALVLGPVFYTSWVIKGTGNANFFYFITLLFLLAQILLIIECVLAMRKMLYLGKVDIQRMRFAAFAPAFDGTGGSARSPMVDQGPALGASSSIRKQHLQ